MSSKSAGKSVAGKKEGLKKEKSSAAHAEASQAPKKSAKHMEPEEMEESGEQKAIDHDELEEQEEAAESSSAASQNGNAAALAAATGSSSEMSASFKNFRHHPDMENFYRFIYENDLRHEAMAIIDEIIADKAQKRLGKPGKH
jgi:hypothetical protein